MKLCLIPMKIRPSRPRKIRLISYLPVLYSKKTAMDPEEPKAMNLATEVEVVLQTDEKKSEMNEKNL